MHRITWCENENPLIWIHPCQERAQLNNKYLLINNPIIQILVLLIKTK